MRPQRAEEVGLPWGAVLSREPPDNHGGAEGGCFRAGALQTREESSPPGAGRASAVSRGDRGVWSSRNQVSRRPFGVLLEPNWLLSGGGGGLPPN
ncbi:unnamed protein product [Rangifer tarandus platyrhynchus]|uniref:Uncharacterized protein n=1 Tax=Rangifer tarandus platyrhynchus TaxID=3082113 RepID=A0ABN9A719_RANTA|nr:unnamed protein product [Rangifer tarandus platyrhynchus]